MYENDPNRNSLGEYHYLGMPVMPGEQANAGVTPYDNVFTAGLRVRNHRASMGLDEFTGLPVQGRPYIGGYYGDDSARDESRVGAVLWGLLKAVVLWPLLLVVVLVALAVGAAWANNTWRDSGPGRGLAAWTLQEVAPGATLAPPSAYLSPRQIAQARTLDAMLRGPAVVPATGVDGYSAYLCQLQPDCARAAEARTGTFFAWRAETFLLAMARQGKPHAAVDACLLPLLTGMRLQPMLMARGACNQAGARSDEARRTAQALERSGWGDLARMLEVVSFAACLDDQPGGCHLDAAPGKLARALQVTNWSR